MIISAKWVKARKPHKCDHYDIPDALCYETITPGGSYLRLYGAAYKGDPLYVRRLCETCAERAMSYWPELRQRMERRSRDE